MEQSVFRTPPIDIDGLPVSASWKSKFKLIRKAGGPRLPDFGQLPMGERMKMHFNILAGLFGPFYYIGKGMWRKGMALFALCFSAILVLGAVLDMLGYGGISKGLGYGAAAVYAVRANLDYYKKMVLGDNGWW
jgi:hypothetical protein